MRQMLSALGLILLAQTAGAETLNLQQAMQELRDRGANAVDGALLYGDPVIMGEFDGQGFKLRLGSCDRDTLGLDCRSTSFSTCKSISDLSRTEALDIIDRYNGEIDGRGTLYSDAIIGIGSVICVKVRRDFHPEDVFDLSDVYDWKLTVRDFEDYLDETLNRRRAEALLGED